MILGIDEVGRGCWAGPLVVGAVVLGDETIGGLTDSKALTRKRREEISQLIHEHALAVGLGWVSAAEVDKNGLSASLRLATRRAVEKVQRQGVAFSEVIIDGTVNFLSATPLEQYVSTLKKADLLIQSVSAASIVAKVARDQYMAEQAATYPDYGFENNVGYGAAFHRQAIESHGVTPLHRLSFKPLAGYARPNESLSPALAVTTSRSIGNVGEDTTCRHIVAIGHEILDRNWRTKWCEIDIVSRKNKKIYFIEVKYRKDDQHGDGLGSITPKKLRQMAFASELYIQKHKLAGVERQLVAASVSGNPAVLVDFLEIT